MLKNFFSGMGDSMMHDAGLPTDYERNSRLSAAFAQREQSRDLHLSKPHTSSLST